MSELLVVSELPVLKGAPISASAPEFPPGWSHIHGCVHEGGQTTHEHAAEHCHCTWSTSKYPDFSFPGPV